MFDGCLLACDIDGTLLFNDCIPQINIEKIKYFVSEGGKFSLATGRTPAAVSAVTDKLDCISVSVVANGSVLYDFKNDKAISEVFISQSDCRIVKAVMDGCGSVGIEAHSGKNVFVLNQSTETEDHEKYENLNAIALDYDSAFDYNWNKVLYLFANETEAKTVKNIISQCESNSMFVDTSATINGVRRHYYEQVPLNVSKATALKQLCKFLKIKNGCCFAIGDYYNDIEMIRSADIGAALIDSPKEVKLAADKVVCRAQNGAVADFIDYLTERKIKNGRNY